MLYTSRTRVDTATTRCIHISLQSENVDWNRLVALARRNHVMPLLYTNLCRIAPQAPPAAILAELHDAFQANAWRCLIQTGELLRLLALLANNGIGAIAYKGPALAAAAYGQLSLRQFADLDVLVRPGDVPVARKMLTAHGYRQLDDQDTKPEEDWIESGYDYKFWCPQSQVLLEMHWAFTPKKFLFPLGVEAVWSRVKMIPISGTLVPSLGQEDLLLVLCVHLAAHCWRGTEVLKWVCDIGELIRTYPSLDWRWLDRHAADLGSRRMFYLGLYLARELVGAPLPEELYARVRRDPSVRRLAGQVRRQLFLEQPARRHGIERQLFYLRMREGWRNKAAKSIDFVSQKARPGINDRAMLPLPRAFSFLYYLMRPARILSKRGRLRFNRLFGRGS